MTIKLSELIDETKEDKIYNFPLNLNGQAYAKNKKKPARITISLPESICGKSLTDLDKWWFRIIAIEKKEYTRAYMKLEANSQSNKKKKGRTIDPNFYAGEVSTDISKNTIKDDRECKICGKKLSEHSSFSDNHTHISKEVKKQ